MTKIFEYTKFDRLQHGIIDDAATDLIHKVKEGFRTAAHENQCSSVYMVYAALEFALEACRTQNADGTFSPGFDFVDEVLRELECVKIAGSMAKVSGISLKSLH
jgi:hypothetical protein